MRGPLWVLGAVALFGCSGEPATPARRGQPLPPRAVSAVELCDVAHLPEGDDPLTRCARLLALADEALASPLGRAPGVDAVVVALARAADDVEHLARARAHPEHADEPGEMLQHAVRSHAEVLRAAARARDDAALPSVCGGRAPGEAEIARQIGADARRLGNLARNFGAYATAQGTRQDLVRRRALRAQLGLIEGRLTTDQAAWAACGALPPRLEQHFGALAEEVASLRVAVDEVVGGALGDAAAVAARAARVEAIVVEAQARTPGGEGAASGDPEPSPPR